MTTWASAFREHDAAVERFVASLRLVPADAWHRPTAPGKWSPAGVALHIAGAASRAAATIVDVSRTQASFHITHAYFGRLPGLTAFRFVSAHTRHHTRALERHFARG